MLTNAQIKELRTRVNAQTAHLRERVHAIIRARKNYGTITLSVLCQNIPGFSERQIDSALQSLRRSNMIKYGGKTHGWVLYTDPPFRRSK